MISQTITSISRLRAKTLAAVKVLKVKREELLELFIDRTDYGPEEAICILEERLESDGLINMYTSKLQEIEEASDLKNAICFWEENYPQSLKQLNDFPIILFGIGSIGLVSGSSSNLIAVVGTRNSLPVYANLANQLAKFLVRNGYVVVSGLAMGIDEASLEGSLISPASSIAVIPGDVKDPKPRTNTYLYNQILGKGGLVISESFSKLVGKHDFPRRNRIIAGLSRATIVVQAPIKSGALITAKLANSYGREVFTFPGDIFDERVSGNNDLLRRNLAQAITSPEDLRYFFPELTSITISKFHDDYSERTSEEREIILALAKEPMNVGQLCQKFDKSVSVIISLVSQLEIEGVLTLDTLRHVYKLK